MRRIIIQILPALLAGLVFSSSGEAAQGPYPQKAITFIVSYAPGGAGDSYFRPLCDMVSVKLGVPIMIVNKGGGGGAIGLKEIAGAKPDGYTIGNHVALSSVKLLGVSPYNQKSIDMIGVVNTDLTLVVCNGKKPWTKVKDMIDYAKAHPEEVTVTTTAKGSHQWIATRVFEAGVNIKLQIIPEPESGGGVLAKVAGGHTDLAIAGPGNFQNQLFDAGTIRILGVFGPKRLPSKYSNVPTLKEQGYDVQSVPVLRCVIGPKGLPKAVREKLTQVFGEAAQSEEYKNFLLPFNATPLWLPGEKGVQAYDEQEKLFRSVLEKSGLIK